MAYIDICNFCNDPETKNVTNPILVEGRTLAICPKCSKTSRQEQAYGTDCRIGGCD